MTRQLIDPPAIVKAAEDLTLLASRINGREEAIAGRSKANLDDYRRQGEDLLKAKSQCGHGKWLPWLKANVRIADRTARVYMQWAKTAVTADLEQAEQEWRRISGNATEEQESDSPVVAVEVPSPRPIPELPPRPSNPPRPPAPRPQPRPNASSREDAASPDADDSAFEPTLEFEPEELESPVPEVVAVAERVTAPQVLAPAPSLPASDHSAHAPSKPRLAEAITLSQWNALPEPERRRLLLDAVGDKKFNAQGDNESIEWALWSWNPVTGCLHNCPYCYARDIANRFYPQKFEPSLVPSRLKAPHNTSLPVDKIAVATTASLDQRNSAKIRSEAAVKANGLKTVFTCSMADLFGRWVPSEWIEAVLTEVRKAKQWNFLFLTKFPIRMAEFDFPENAWVGTTVDCQARVANAEKAFRKIKAGVKWLSIEPLIEPLKFEDLGAFQWIVIGGSSPSSQTPEWLPPRGWVNIIEDQAHRLGVRVYEKANLLYRIREYPGVELNEAKQAPASLRYLPTVEAK